MGTVDDMEYGGSAMKMTSVATALLFAICVTLLSACGGGEADLTARAISDEELALMVLPQEELGAEYAELELREDESGFRTNDMTIEEDVDPDDERQDVERFGRLNGYSETYASSSFLGESAFGFDEEGMLVAIGVELLRDREDAPGYLEDSVSESEAMFLDEAEGQEGLELELDSRRFSPGGVGDGALGLQMYLGAAMDDVSVLSVNTTFLAFRRGRLLGIVGVVLGGEKEDKRDEVTALARKLDERIQAVLRGDITPSPAATP
jgi:hypothetical protein